MFKTINNNQKNHNFNKYFIANVKYVFIWDEYIMYELIIKTIYNTIHLTVDDYKTPEIQEILNQPYVLSVEVREVKNENKIRRRKK